ncbi:uncharacterized protein LOC141629451 [Silene latifolia]|uniref:uncharacterized protein LOC141629451 n=1 Tax=Silene latifolia TaxID=37657 RepID=UPI003D7870BE
MKSRQARNKVLRIASVQGQWLTEPGQIQSAFLSFYQQLLGETQPRKAVNTTIVKRGPVCNQEHWDWLNKPVTNDEIKEALFHIPNHKAPGPDGYSSAFFKDAWSVVGEELCEVVKDFFIHGRLLKQLNHTLVTLVPKEELPQDVTQFRPISCCNVVYKIISKLICSRLTRVLPDIISPTQGGFIKGRNIIENILVCQEVIRLYNRASVSPGCLIKVDLKKAYDSVNWDFLQQMLDALSFPEHFKHLIMECVTIASYSLVINGETFGHFHGKKGLRQGDPLSPLLFTIAMEYLSRVLNFTTEVLHFRYHSLCGKLKLHHLMFADDLLLFSRGDSHSIMLLLRSFASFSAASGLEMNKNKSNIYFNGVSKRVKDQIFAKSGCVEGKLPFKYLGVPITAGKLGKRECQVLVEKIVERIRMFGSRHISYAGRLTLVQSVLTSLYTYWANIFLLPKGDLQKINSICRNYLWDGTSTYGRVPLVGWEQLFLKGCPWPAYVPKSHLSGNWKAICRTRDALTTGYLNGIWLADSKGYSVQSGYQWLRHKEPKVGWAKLVWCTWAIPKHCFLNWLIRKNALNTKVRLHKIGICPDEWCCISCRCDKETIPHLFQRLQCVLDVRDSVQMVAFLCLAGNVWQQRNAARIEGVVLRPDVLSMHCKALMKIKLLGQLSRVKKISDRQWLEQILIFFVYEHDKVFYAFLAYFVFSSLNPVNFLWAGKSDYGKAPAISWDTCCAPKLEGGLGLKVAKDWNRAILGKYAWWIASKKDHLWVRWVNHVYMKGKEWTDYSPPSDCSWSWRKIYHNMILFSQAYTNHKWLNSNLDYTVKSGYEWLRHSKPKVPWFHLCWNRLNIPKSAFIFWAAQHMRLLTKDRLNQMGTVVDLTCDICRTQSEDHQHLFYDCAYSAECCRLLHQRLLINFPMSDLVRWYSSARCPKLLRKISGASHVYLVYIIWRVRNEARLKLFVRRPEHVIQLIITDVKARFYILNVSPLKVTDKGWLDKL